MESTKDSGGDRSTTISTDLKLDSLNLSYLSTGPSYHKQTDPIRSESKVAAMHKTFHDQTSDFDLGGIQICAAHLTLNDKVKFTLTAKKKQPAPQVEKELRGYLKKKSPSLFRGWQVR